jgi:5,10-methylenetetrahydromethanopterin reductase
LGCADDISARVTPEQVAAQAQVDAGVHRIEFCTPHGLTDQRGVELLRSAVLPLFARHPATVVSRPQRQA